MKGTTKPWWQTWTSLVLGVYQRQTQAQRPSLVSWLSLSPILQTASNFKGYKWSKPGGGEGGGGGCPNVRLRFLYVQCIHDRYLFLQLEQLHIMGVTDDATCLRALEATKGDLQAALELLMGTGNPWMSDNHYCSCIVLVSALHVQHLWYGRDVSMI